MSPDPPPPLPAPSEFNMSGVLTAREFGVDGELEATVRSEAISALPLRSRYEGRLVASLKQNGKPLLDVQTVVRGEYEGSPSDAMTQAITRFLNTLDLAGRAANAATAPSTRPASP